MHYSTDPCRVPKKTALPSKRGESSGGDERTTAATAKDKRSPTRAKSTAALMEVQSFQQDVSAHEASLQAGTQAPPVDTHNVIWPIKTIDVNLVTGEMVLTENIHPKRGRPRIHPDRRAYKADKERQRRAKLKAEKEAK